jgi:hypothetical protein
MPAKKVVAGAGIGVIVSAMREVDSHDTGQDETVSGVQSKLEAASEHDELR